MKKRCISTILWVGIKIAILLKYMMNQLDLAIETLEK